MGCTMRNIVETSIKDTRTVLSNPSIYTYRQRVTHDCASILDSIAKGISLFLGIYDFLHGTSHPYTTQIVNKCTML